MRVLILLLSSALLAGCSTVNPYYDPSRQHHTATGFRNNYTPQVSKPFSALLRWRWEAWRGDLPKPPTQATPQQTPDLGLITAHSLARSQPGVAPVPLITWVGHATMLVQAGRLNVLTDPMFSERASPVQFLGPVRAQPPGLALAQLPPIDIVLVTHNHYDHLDEASVRQLAPGTAGAEPPLFIVPLGLKPWFNNIGIERVVELDWWDRHVHQGTAFHLTPAQHWSARSTFDRSETLWGGFAVFAPDLHWFYSGDTGYSQDFKDIRARFAEHNGAAGFDFALLPIGAYEPRWFMKEQHTDPAEAVQIHLDIGARQSVGVHWGTFNLTDESLDQPPRELAAARDANGLADDAFFVMKVGETRRLQARKQL